MKAFVAVDGDGVGGIQEKTYIFVAERRWRQLRRTHCGWTALAALEENIYLWGDISLAAVEINTLMADGVGGI